MVPLLMTGIGCNRNDSTTMIKPPVAEKVPHKLVAHGDTRIDNYYWMRLADEQKNAKEPDEQTRKVLDYLHGENDYCEAVLAPVKELREHLYQEITGRIKPDDESVPYLDNGYYYYTRYEEGKEYPLYCRRKGSLDAPEEILFNANELAAGHSYFQIGGWSVSPQNDLLVFGVDTIGRRQYVLMFKDLTTGNLLADEVPNTTGGAVWANDNKTVFYTRRDPVTLRAQEILRHKLGTPTEKDPQVYFEKDETFSTGIFKTKSRKYLMIWSNQTLSTEYRYLDADKPEGSFRVIQPRAFLLVLLAFFALDGEYAASGSVITITAAGLPAYLETDVTDTGAYYSTSLSILYLYGLVPGFTLKSASES